MFKYKSTAEIIAIYAALAIIGVLAIFLLLASVKFFTTPYHAPAPTITEKAANACIKQGGFPVIANRTVSGVNSAYNQEYFDKCLFKTGENLVEKPVDSN